MNINRMLQKVPSSPGIYIMKGAREKPLYVGKAKNLKHRMRSYFQKSSSLDARKSKMIKEVRDVDYIITKNELEALVLESNFIKRLKPRYNVILRDDKNYPYIKLTVNEEWPWLEVVRKIKRDGAKYFGPYVPAGSMWEMLKFIRRNFPVRICTLNLRKPFRPCVQYQMGRCLGPCAESLRGEREREKYQEAVREVQSFILGEKKELLTSLQRRMQRYSEEMEFEEAAKVRDRLKSLEKAWEIQRVISADLGDVDVIGLYREKHEACIYVLFIRNGIVIGQKDFFFRKIDEVEMRELIKSFIEQFYSKEVLIPPRIILPIRSVLATQKKWLSAKRRKSLRLSGAHGDLENMVLKMANDNAFYSFNRHKDKKADEILLHIQERLKLKNIPRRIGAIDVSNISGSEAVGAFVVYADGKFIKDDYRLFKIRTVSGIDDFAMIGEVVGRYLKKISEADGIIPDVVLIDGGRGQLDAALRAMKEYDLPIEFIGMAKARSKESSLDAVSHIQKDLDRVYLPGRRNPVYLEPSHPETLALQRIRDEVHRCAIRFHKKLRGKRLLESPLERIKGIGNGRRLLLLKHFGTINAIQNASVDEIAAIKGMNRKVAENVKRSLASERRERGEKETILLENPE